MRKRLACSNCGSDYVVGEGGSLECGRCGHIAGDISLLFGEKPFEGTNQCPQPDDIAPEEYMGEPRRDIHELV